MDTRVAVISIIVEQEDAIEELNILLHEARQYIVGRVGSFCQESVKQEEWEHGHQSGTYFYYCRAG